MMRRLIVIFSVLLLGAMAYSQTWRTANQVTLEWDAVTTLSDGSPLPAGSEVKYQVYLRKSSQPQAAGVKFGSETTATQAVITLEEEGNYFLGVSSLRYVNDQLASESTIAWSDDPENCLNGEAFGVVYMRAPAMVRNLGVK